MKPRRQQPARGVALGDEAEEQSRKEHEAVETLVFAGWVWDGDQWVLPRNPGVTAPSPALLVTVCELRDGDGLTHCAMVHHAGQPAMNGMCVERRADKAEVEAEAAEWRAFLSPGVKEDGRG